MPFSLPLKIPSQEIAKRQLQHCLQSVPHGDSLEHVPVLQTLNVSQWKTKHRLWLQRKQSETPSTAERRASSLLFSSLTLASTASFNNRTSILLFSKFANLTCSRWLFAFLAASKRTRTGMSPSWRTTTSSSTSSPLPFVIEAKTPVPSLNKDHTNDNSLREEPDIFIHPTHPSFHCCCSFSGEFWNAKPSSASNKVPALWYFRCFRRGATIPQETSHMCIDSLLTYFWDCSWRLWQLRGRFSSKRLATYQASPASPKKAKRGTRSFSTCQSLTQLVQSAYGMSNSASTSVQLQDSTRSIFLTK